MFSRGSNTPHSVKDNIVIKLRLGNQFLSDFHVRISHLLSSVLVLQNPVNPSQATRHTIKKMLSCKFLFPAKMHPGFVDDALAFDDSNYLGNFIFEKNWYQY